MTESDRSGSKITTRFAGIWLAVAILLLIARTGRSIRTFNHTIDEPYHIGSAVALCEAKAHVLGVEHGPLPRLVAGLALRLAGVSEPLNGPDLRQIRGEWATYSFGQSVLFRGPIPYWRVLTVSRWAMLLVFPPLCLTYVFLIGRLIGGPRVAVASTFFFSLDPTLLGHAFWVCTDVPACAGFLAALYHGLKWLIRQTPASAAIAGIALGLAISCKFSCFLIAPCLLLIALMGGGTALGSMNAEFQGAPHGHPARRVTLQLMIAAGSVFMSLWATYFFAVGRLSDQDLFSAESWNQLPRWLSELPIPMPSLPLGIAFLLRHNWFGHSTYLNGQLGFHGHWNYFVEAFVLKEPIAVLAALALAMTAFIGSPGSRKQWRVALTLLLPAVVFFAAAMMGNLNIGIRHILPALPCLYLFVCWSLLGRTNDIRSRAIWRPIALCAFVLVSCIETFAVGPNYLSYFNVLAGGPVGGERYLLDSNIDWGQDMSRAAEFLHAPEQVGRSYSIRAFDMDPGDLAEALGLRRESTTENPHGLFVISLNVLHQLFGYEAPTGKPVQYPPDYSWIENYPRVARVGTSIDIYDLDAPPLKK